MSETNDGIAEVTDPLEATLLDLLFELQDADLPLILGGGYGLYLRQRLIAASGDPLLLSVVPPLRSTNDLDVFLRTELLASSERLKPLKAALDRLKFDVIPSAKNYQFARKFRIGEQDHDVKVDLLTREPDGAAYPQLKYDARRVKPNPSVEVHAHTTPEAVAVEDDLTPCTLIGPRTSGDPYSGVVYLPSSYAFLLMKLFALRDQWQQEEKDYGRKHALDIYAIIALLTRAEYSQSQLLRDRYQKTAEAREAGRIVATLFAGINAPGSLRLREHPNYPAQAEAEMNTFLETLTDLFPDPTFESDQRNKER